MFLGRLNLIYPRRCFISLCNTENLFHFLQLQYLSRLKAMIFKCLKNCYSLF